jgi:hypothetical protein
MRKFAIARMVALVATLSLPVLAGAQALPPKLTYLFYMGGERVGQADVTIKTTGDAIHFASHVTVGSGDQAMVLDTRTQADAKTFAFRSFAFDGTKGGKPVATHIDVKGDSVVGWIVSGGPRSPKARRVSPQPTVIWEDWVP